MKNCLENSYSKRNVDIGWNTELTGLTQQNDHVITTVRQPDGSSYEIRALWVVGCDGARSAVRNLNSIEFEGAPYEHVFFVADTTATGSMVPDELNVYLWEDGFHLFFPNARQPSLAHCWNCAARIART